MKLSTVLAMVDEIKPNAFSASTKTVWLNEIEGLVQTEVLLVRIEEIISYDYETDVDTELLVPAPHNKIYAAYLMAQIDFANGEYKKYQNAMELFNSYFGEYQRWFAQNYRPADTHPDADEDERPGNIGRPWRGYYLSAYGLAVKHGYTESESAWIASLKGYPGENGKPVELRYDETTDMIQWRVLDDAQWKDLMAASELRGEIIDRTIAAAETAQEKAEAAALAAAQAAEQAEDAAPTATIERVENGAEITVQDRYGVSKAVLADGKDGPPGISPSITVKTSNSNQYILTITDKNGSFDTPNLRGGGGTGGGTGGGGSTNGAVLTAENTSGWITKTIATGAEVDITLRWSSVENGMATGNGILTLSVNDALKTSYEIQQGDVTVPVGKYLTAGLCKVQIEITDAYGNRRYLNSSITSVSVDLTSYFDGTVAYTGAITFPYTPTGAVSKTMHFLVDGTEIGTDTVTSSGREQTYTIPAQSHGSHTLEVYFTAEIDGSPVESNHLFYDLITYVDGRTEPIIAVPMRFSSVKQYSTVAVPYIVYTPNALTSEVELKEGTESLIKLTVDRTQQIWSYKATQDGTANLSIVSGNTTKPISFTVTPNSLGVSAETANLELYLTSAGRSNNESDPLKWTSGAVSAELTGFNLISDGWMPDDNKNTVLRVSGDARVYIPFNIFGSDFRTTGKTIEVEFATRDVLNYDATIFSSWSGERGIKITAQKALLKSEQSEIFTQYKEDETVRVAFTVEKRAENRLLAIYINGIMSGVVQYPTDDDFSQTNPVGISIGSNDCTTDIYCIRVYSNNLSRYQVLDNWIADTQDLETLTDRYSRNNIFDDYGNIVTSKIPPYLPYMVLNVDSYAKLPQSKGDKKTIGGYYVDPLHPERNFSFSDAEIDVQGTSSQYYARKNYKIKFKGGFVIGGETKPTYQLRSTSIPTDEFTYKADVASSEGANNVELAKLYDDICPVKTPPQLEDSRVRQGIDGYPMLMFYGENTLTFLGKYNFNNDKGTEEVFGFKSGDESWEVLQNNTDMVIWKDDDFSGDRWKTSFEGRYPDKNTDTTNLAAFSSWLKSTDTTAVSSESEKEARIAKFKSEFANWCNVDAMLFNYIFTEAFLMVDNRAKNAFPTRYAADGKWLILPYDYDTAIGINNEGELKFGYELEDTDLINGNNVYNGQDSVLYVNMRLAYADEIMEMYKTLRSGDTFDYAEIERRFSEHQAVWGEAVFNEDAKFKYLDPLINEGNKTYLPMLQGAKAEQRKWWLYNRFRYLDSKYNAGDALEDYIMVRSYAVGDITVTPYADIYATAKFDSALVQKRALRGGSYTLENPLSGGRDAVISIYSASQLSSVGDLSGLKVGMADFSKATKLSTLKVGDASSGYDNPNLTDLTIGNLSLLRTLDVRNCSALTQAVDISGCKNIEHVYFDGTAITGVTLPNGGILKTLHLPNTVTNLTVLNQRQLADFTMPSYANVSTLRIENTPNINAVAIASAMPNNSRVRLIGFDSSVENVNEIYAMFDKLDTFRGLDEYGNNTDKAVVSGTIHVDMVSNADLEQFAARYPSVTIDYTEIGNVATFMVDDEVYFRGVFRVGEQITVPSGVPTKESTAQYHFSFKGWSLDGVNTTTDLGTMGEEDVTIYALFDETVRTYTVRFLNGTTVLQTGFVAYGTTPSYTGTMPESPDGWDFGGWIPAIAPVTGDVDYVAKFVAPSVTRQLLNRTIKEYSNDSLLKVGRNSFSWCKKLTNVDLPNVTYIDARAFVDSGVTNINLPNVGTIYDAAFSGCEKIESMRLPAVPPRLGYNAFGGINSACVFYVPTGSLAVYQEHVSWSSLTTTYSFVEEDR